jgi:large subunit ribosomal protein L30e
MDISKELKVAIKTGKVNIGYKVAIKTLEKKKAKLVVVSASSPTDLIAKIKSAAGEVPLSKYPGSSWDLGGLCGKPFPVTTVTIIEPGESGILKLDKEE